MISPEWGTANAEMRVLSILRAVKESVLDSVLPEGPSFMRPRNHIVAVTAF